MENLEKLGISFSMCCSLIGLLYSLSRKKADQIYIFWTFQGPAPNMKFFV